MSCSDSTQAWVEKSLIKHLEHVVELMKCQLIVKQEIDVSLTTDVISQNAEEIVEVIADEAGSLGADAVWAVASEFERKQTKKQLKRLKKQYNRSLNTGDQEIAPPEEQSAPQVPESSSAQGIHAGGGTSRNIASEEKSEDGKNSGSQPENPNPHPAETNVVATGDRGEKDVPLAAATSAFNSEQCLKLMRGLASLIEPADDSKRAQLLKIHQVLDQFAGGDSPPVQSTALQEEIALDQSEDADGPASVRSENLESAQSTPQAVRWSRTLDSVEKSLKELYGQETPDHTVSTDPAAPVEQSVKDKVFNDSAIPSETERAADSGSIKDNTMLVDLTIEEPDLDPKKRRLSESAEDKRPEKKRRMSEPTISNAETPSSEQLSAFGTTENPSSPEPNGQGENIKRCGDDKAKLLQDIFGESEGGDVFSGPSNGQEPSVTPSEKGVSDAPANSGDDLDSDDDDAVIFVKETVNFDVESSVSVCKEEAPHEDPDQPPAEQQREEGEITSPPKKIVLRRQDPVHYTVISEPGPSHYPTTSTVPNNRAQNLPAPATLPETSFHISPGISTNSTNIDPDDIGQTSKNGDSAEHPSNSTGHCSNSTGHCSESAELEDENPAKRFKCTLCGKILKTRSGFRNHTALHSELRPFKCDKCPSTFKLRFYLKEHMKYIHCDLKRFHCDDCNKSFKREASLRVHKCLWFEGVQN